jgi:hypothetical protein
MRAHDHDQENTADEHWMELRADKNHMPVEQRSMILNSAGQEFHGYSVAEIKELMTFLSSLAAPDAARWTPGGAP